MSNTKYENQDFKSGDRVRMYLKDSSMFITGEVTIVTEDQCKVLWDQDWDYTYYPKERLMITHRQI